MNAPSFDPDAVDPEGEEDDPVLEPDDDDPEWEVELPPLEPTDVSEAEVLAVARKEDS